MKRTIAHIVDGILVVEEVEEDVYPIVPDEEEDWDSEWYDSEVRE